MLKRNLFYALVTGLLCVAVILFDACKTKPKDPGFNPHIVGFTSGSVSIKSAIKIRLSENVTDIALNTAIPKKIFKFSPDIKGEAFLVDEQTIEFRPEQMLKPATDYSVTFNVAEVLPKVEKEFKSFDFSFSTIQPAFYYSIDGLKMYSQEQNNLYYLSGTINTSDFIANENVEKILTIDSEKKKVSATWAHGNDNQHRFVIDSIQSGEKAYEIRSIDRKSVG